MNIDKVKRKAKKLFRNPGEFLLDALKKKKSICRGVQRLALGRWGNNRRLAYWSALLNDQLDDFERLMTLMAGQPKIVVRCLRARGEQHAQAGRLDMAINDYKAAVALQPDHGSYQRLMELQRKGGAIWDRVDVLREYLEFAPPPSDQPLLWAELGHLLFKMSRFQEAADSLEEALKLKPNDRSWLYWLAFAKERAGGEDQPDQNCLLLYDKALKFENPRNVRLGRGFLHQKKARWLEAAAAYAAELDQNPENPYLAYSLGRARASLFNWEGAIEAYRLALTCGAKPDESGQDDLILGALMTLTDEERAECCYSLGLALERLDNFPEAASYYQQAACEHPKPRDDYFYRWGCALNSAGRHQEACEAFLQSKTPRPVLDASKVKGSRHEILLRIDKDRTNPQDHYALGQLFELQDNWAHAARCYQMAVDRFPQHNAEWHYRLGQALFRLGRHEEACAAFRAARRIYRRPTLAALPKGLSTHATNMFAYVEDLETLPIRDKVILYESFHGRLMGCNPYAMFKYLLDHPDYADYLHVWALNDKKSMPEEYRGRDNVVFAPFKSPLYYRYLATAKYLINNNTFFTEFIRRPEQKYLNTWHGTPLKVLGKDAIGDFLVHGNTSRNFLQASHLLYPGSFTREKLLKMSEVDELASGQAAETGYPRTDLILMATEKEKTAWRDRLNLTADRPVILYAPTWRGEAKARPEDAEMDVARCLADLRELAKLPAQVVFRGHHLVESLIEGQSLPVTTASSADLDASEVLAITDILITDYSSIFFDFLPARKPIVYYAYDQAEYQAQRGGGGFYLPLEDLPGTICRNIDELGGVLRRLLAEPYQADDKHLEAIKTFCPYEDGRSTERAVDFLFNDCQERVIKREPDSRKSVLIRAGHFMPNGITTSFLNLTHQIDRDKIRLALFIDREEVAKYDDRMKKFAEFSRDQAQMVFKVGGMLRGLEEKMVEDLTFANYSLNAFPAIKAIKMNLYNRELLRLVGYSHFDVLVNFDGYGEYGGALFAAQPYGGSARKLIYLHNDMHDEQRIRFPYLELLFGGYYKLYDRLISVSEGVMKSNLEKLSSKYNIPENSFIYLNNTLNEAAIINKAQEPVEEDIQAFIAGRTSFITLGRLSPEKDHEKLIRSFAAVQAEYPEACLLIVGYGPLEAKLLKLINQLGLDKAVKLTGYKANPYPLLQAADCFVLSSNHEGQGLVLLEAMILNRPIITTDLPPTRSVMELDGGGFGLLVENSQEGLIEGMRTFLKDGWPVKRFEAERYTQKCLKMFEDLVLSPGGSARLAALADDRPETAVRGLIDRGEEHAQAGRLDMAINDYKAALAVQLDDEIYKRLIELQRTSGVIWDRAETLREYLEFAPDQAPLWAELGHLRFKMNCFREAAEAFDQALTLKPHEANWQYWLAFAQERAGENGAQVRLLYNYSLRTEEPRNARLGEGFPHQKHGRWAEAAASYAAKLEKDALNRYLAYNLGKARARCFDWAGAIRSFKQALTPPDLAPGDAFEELGSLKPEEIAECHYNLALALERLGRFAEAAENYQGAIEAHPGQPRGDYFYRLGCCLETLDQPQEACVIFLKSLNSAAPVLDGAKIEKIGHNDLIKSVSDKTSPQGFYLTGQIYERTGDWAEAASCYGQALDRAPQHNAEWHYRLGQALFRLGRHEEACAAFRAVRRIYRRPSLAALPKGLSPQAVNMFVYAEDLETLPVRDKVILYEAFHGRIMGCNPYAIFKYLLEHPDYADYLHVWALNDKESMPEEYCGRDNVVFAPLKSPLYYRYLATAKYLINNVSFGPEFVRRPEQRYLNTCHGTPLKTMGKDMTNGFLVYGNVSRNFLQASHLIYPSSYAREKLLNPHEVDKLISGQTAETGYPRTDLILKATEKEKNAWRARLNLDSDRPVILYAPTWRGDARALAKDIKVDIERCLADLEELAKLPAQIVFRGHSLVERFIKDMELPVTAASSICLDASEVLAITDILITDYSSIFFDFLPTRKPIVYYAYDEKEYRAERGDFYLSLESLPGKVCRNLDELNRSLRGLLAEPYQADEKYLAAVKTFCPHEDGRSTERAVEFLFNDCQDQVIKPEPDSRQSVLIRVSNFLANGITASFLNLASQIDRDKIKMALFIDSDAVAKYDGQVDKFLKFSRDKAQLVFKKGGMLRTIEEKMVEALTAANYNLNASPEILKIKMGLYKRELLRLIGHTHFDALVNFDGYSEYGGALFASQPYDGLARKVIYLHNNMYDEWRLKYPWLEAMFSYGYNNYDALLSVSEETMVVNRDNLSAKYNLPERLFRVATNVMNPEEALSKAEQALDDELESFVGDRVIFMTMGRLSPEKDHEKLIRAFAAVNAEYPDTCLVILGTGLLAAKLQALVDQLKLNDAVKLPGYQDNPYPMLKRADCFVLSSNHEGQPLVIMEAMILNRPVITTDLPSTRSVMEIDGGGFGLLVENSLAGLVEGMRTFLKEGLPVKRFEVDRYNQKCLKMFEELVFPPQQPRLIPF